MKRKDLPILVALIALLVAWPYLDRWIVRTFFPERLVAPPAQSADPAAPDATPVPPPDGERPTPSLQAAPDAQPPTPPAPEPGPAPELSDDPPSDAPERRFTLRNDRAEFVFSSRGGALVEVRLLEYRAALARDSAPVRFDFSGAPALAWEGVPGGGVEHDYEATPSPDGRRIRFERRTPAGVVLAREIELGDGFLLRIRDAWSRPAGAGTATVNDPRLTFGAMENLPGETLTRGMVYLGIDTLSPGGESVRFWGREFPGFFTRDQKAAAAFRPKTEMSFALPESGLPVNWASVKNKYFVQILRPEGGANGVAAKVRRIVTAEETSDPKHRPRVEIGGVAASLRFPETRIEPGAEPAVRTMEYYFGPKKFWELEQLAHHQADVMEFRRLPAVAKLLLRTLVFLYRLVPNYGIAIILLTILIRLVFWPITRKGAKSMRRMQEIQPLVTELRARYKDNPQRQQKEIMALYKEHKVNPIGGCLPMLIQIPVFIALFDVLGGAIELRFAPFLWIRDLSEAENLLPGLLPFGLSLNLLPLIMTAMQIWQQKLTPQAGDPSQQKMMALMPVIMLVFFYNFASGLVLYWTTSQVLMIVSQLYQLHYVKKK